MLILTMGVNNNCYYEMMPEEETLDDQLDILNFYEASWMGSMTVDGT